MDPGTRGWNGPPAQSRVTMDTTCAHDSVTIPPQRETALNVLVPTSKLSRATCSIVQVSVHVFSTSYDFLIKFLQLRFFF